MGGEYPWQSLNLSKNVVCFPEALTDRVGRVNADLVPSGFVVALRVSGIALRVYEQSIGVILRSRLLVNLYFNHTPESPEFYNPKP